MKIRIGLTHAALLYHKLPSLWQETVVFSENSHLTERAAVKMASVLSVFQWVTISIAILQQSQYAKKEKNREIFWTTRR